MELGGSGIQYLQAGQGIYPKEFELQEGGNAANHQELTLVSDWGEQREPTPCNLKNNGYRTSFELLPANITSCLHIPFSS